MLCTAIWTAERYTCGILIDLKKALDAVNQSIVLAKLENDASREIVVHGVNVQKHS